MTALERARAAWSGAGAEKPPDWIEALALACDGSSLRVVAKKLLVSPALISLTLNNRRVKTDMLKGRVFAVIMAEMMPCPVRGVIGKGECAEEQARPFMSTNPLRIQMFQACKQCRYRKVK